MNAVRAIEVIDSHTAGEPTRVVIDGWPSPAGKTMAERRETLCRECDPLRRAVILEPRGHDAIVGALLTPPVTDAAAGVIFFNDVGYLGMCGHGTIGVVRTLEYLGRLTPGDVRLDTPVGQVRATLNDDGSVVVRNVPARLHRTAVTVDVPGVGAVTGDIAWGGNWFFLADIAGLSLDLAHRVELLDVTIRIRDALHAAGIAGDDGAPIDHVELFGPPVNAGADSRNFVLCPGRAYDRSPCGTGTSAKMAALHGKGLLAVGQRWRQESVLGSMFTGWLSEEAGQLIPHIQGNAWITGRNTLLLDPDDPFQFGFV